MNAHDAVVLAEQHGELDRSPLAVPSTVLGKEKKTIAALQGEKGNILPY